MEHIEHEGIKEFSEIDWTDNRQFIDLVMKGDNEGEYKIKVTKRWKDPGKDFRVSVVKVEVQWYKCPFWLWASMEMQSIVGFNAALDTATISINPRPKTDFVGNPVGGAQVSIESIYYKRHNEMSREIEQLLYQIEIQP